jgi:hypothetical protein
MYEMDDKSLIHKLVARGHTPSDAERWVEEAKSDDLLRRRMIRYASGETDTFEHVLHPKPIER